MTDAFQPLHLEMLLPHEIRAMLGRRPVVYVPLGTIEWHSEHLPVGLDALTAHGICLRAAAEDGGLVCPPLYYGTGGSHGSYPFTIMMDDEAAISALLQKSLQRFEVFGVRLVVLFSGHFAPLQLTMIADVAAAWNATSSPLRILSLGVNMVEGASLAPDHAGVFETTLLHALWPDRVDIGQLPALAGDPDQGGDPYGKQRHDPGHALFGIFGPDPRSFDVTKGVELLQKTVDWLVMRVRSIEV